jgi:hypothetical protein
VTFCLSVLPGRLLRRTMRGLFSGYGKKLSSLQFRGYSSKSRCMLCGLTLSLFCSSQGGLLCRSQCRLFVRRHCGLLMCFLFRHLSRPVCGIFCGLPRGQLRAELCLLLCNPRRFVLRQDGKLGPACSLSVGRHRCLARYASLLKLSFSSCLQPQTGAFPGLRSRSREVPVLGAMKIRPGIKGRYVIRSLVLVPQPFVI